MWDVVRHLFRAPTDQEKAADLAFVQEGGVLEVSALLARGALRASPDRYESRKVRVQFLNVKLFVYGDRVETVRRRGERQVFRRGEWHLTAGRPRGGGIGRSSWMLVTFVSLGNGHSQNEFQVPSPDVDLLLGVMT